MDLVDFLKENNTLLRSRIKLIVSYLMNFGQRLHQSTFRLTSGGESRILNIVVNDTNMLTKSCRRTITQREIRFVITEVGSELKTWTKSTRKNSPFDTFFKHLANHWPSRNKIRHQGLNFGSCWTYFFSSDNQRFRSKKNRGWVSWNEVYFQWEWPVTLFHQNHDPWHDT